MSQTFEPTRTPRGSGAGALSAESTRSSFTESASRTLAILAAVGGRYGFLYWGPIVVWVAAAGASRGLEPFWDPGVVPFETSAFFWLTQSRMLAVLLLWLGSSQLAVALGYRRGPVFLVTSAVTVTMFLTTQVLAEVANRAEWGFVGAGGSRVLALDIPDAPEMMPSTLLEGVLAATVADVGLPFVTTMGLVIGVLHGMRCKERGLIGIVVIVLLVMMATSVLVVAVSLDWPHVLLKALAAGLSWAASLALVWLAFRRASV